MDEGGADLLTVSEQLDTRSAAGRLVLNIQASQWERATIGERTSLAMQHKQAQGEYTGGQATRIFRLAADGEHVEPVPEVQAAIEFARQLRAQGATLRGVARELESRGIRSRTGRPFAPVRSKRMVTRTESGRLESAEATSRRVNFVRGSRHAWRHHDTQQGRTSCANS